jgi:hypothetical protein
MTAPTDATTSLACKRPGSSLGVTFEDTGCPMHSCPSRPGIRSRWLGVLLRLVAPGHEDKATRHASELDFQARGDVKAAAAQTRR